MGRAPCCEKIGLKKGRWTGEEDEILKKYIQHHGEGSWRSLPKNAGLLRCGKSCRLRWINYLRADLKRGCFSAEEEDIIIKLHASDGNRWSLIAGHLPGRTDNEIKNYWNSHLSRRIHTFARFREARSSMLIDARKLVVGCQRKSGKNINRMGFKRKSGNGDIRREKEENKGSKSVEKETQSTTSSDRESRVLDPCEERERVVQVQTFVLGGEWEEMGMVLEFEEMESGILDSSDEKESGTMMDLGEEIDSWVFGSDEETRNEIRGGEIGEGGSEERQNGVVGLNEERETGVMGVNGEERGRKGELCSPMDSGCEEWDLGVLGVEGTEFLSWLCDCESWERELEVVAEHEQRSFADWLLSGDSDIV